jgi:protocatechuate 3,4-dioxygenase beta subunit
MTSKLTRREMLERVAAGAASLVVSQSLMSLSPALGDGDAACVLTAGLTEGPFFVDEKLNRSDIRTDPTTGVVSAGVPLALTFNVERLVDGVCTPLPGAYLDVWHCDAGGVYSDVQGAAGHEFLRGYQVTDAKGVARFATVYPGWYYGRPVHIHFKLRLYAGERETYEFTSQFFFDEALTDRVHAQAPYATRGQRHTRNSSDRIYNGLSSAEKTGLTLQTAPSGDGYRGVITLRVQTG